MIVRLHNDLRRRVAKGLETRSADGKAQPSAADMIEIQWDTELEFTAQKFVRKKASIANDRQIYFF